ncbi:hypothetical protein L2725_22295 [Shewanella corallii]|uniref:Restriction endonuclease type II EcoRII C-terminal domain-containing protein n=1 Tax=Shewanella corallii TaxID=560080 RepID=A0ABT0NF24_9GAMM|nr:type II restriction endonuclease [Shewanella corallii]MCL2916471.1 hypothetical protein [Shewanella corallii]
MFEQLSDVFVAAGIKYLSKVDANPKESNQHEIGGLPRAGIGKHIGMPKDGSKTYLQATLVFLDEDTTEVVEDTVSWYDTRFLQEDRGPEWRLYYKESAVTERIREGDFLLLGLTYDKKLLMVFCPPDSHYEDQIRAIFAATGVKVKGKSLNRLSLDALKIAMPIRLMLAQYGISLDSQQKFYLDKILERFGPRFPDTKSFSCFAREFKKDICPVEYPDSSLIEWMDIEEVLFRQLERYLVGEKLKTGFGESGCDVDDFISFSLSVQNRRKSRSGQAFENHIEHILKFNNVLFRRGAKTEGKQKPDFLFPGPEEYKCKEFPSERLRILGAKTTCKDRWRQVLAEGERVSRKHLITMEPSISKEQTDEMARHHLQLVVPLPIHESYSDEQRQWLQSFKQFIDEVQGISNNK